jgi:ABC-type transport system involved in cytochrome c biogenesis permease subunit
MQIKYTLQGALIYLTMLFFAATLSACIVRRLGGRRSAASAPPETLRQLIGGFWLAGFLAAAASLTWRGFHTGHPPMQNLFEFFLCMAAFLWPLSQLSRWKNAIDTTLQDAVLGILILIPAGFVFDEAVRRLPPALQSPLFVPHVATYVAGYIMLARGALMALPMFRTVGRERLVSADSASRQSVAVGFLLITAGLLLGSLWGKICWGHYWQWDPKEMWSLATWMIYGAYFHQRLKSGLRRPRLIAALLWIGLLFVVLTLTWINLSRLFKGMHTYA